LISKEINSYGLMSENEDDKIENEKKCEEEEDNGVAVVKGMQSEMMMVKWTYSFKCLSVQ